jgi:hypothetical protein
MKTWKSIGIVVVVSAIMALGYLSIGSAEEGQNIEQMLAEAKTPADHEAIAAFYAKEAEAAHKKQAEHQKMQDLYAATPALKTKSTTALDHCADLVKKYKEIAEDYQDLAKLHKGMAKPAK